MRLSRGFRDMVFPPRGNLTRVHFREREWVEALVPDDETFGLARELILQRVYDRAGGFPPGTVVDCGAHVGLFSLAAAMHASKVVSVEPDPVNFRLLEINRELNRAEHIVCLNRALWSEPGEVSFRRTGQTTGGTVSGDGDLTVQTTTIDDLVAEHGEIDLLKLDIEGAEFAAIEAATSLERVKRIAAELHLDAPGAEAPLVEKLEGCGFRVEVVRAADLYGRGELRSILRNWRALKGQTKLKLGLAAYILAPVEKPRQPENWHELPLLFAFRD